MNKNISINDIETEALEKGYKKGLKEAAENIEYLTMIDINETCLKSYDEGVWDSIRVIEKLLEMVK